MGRLRILGAMSLLALAPACDPCDGVVSCNEDARLGIGGQMVVRDTGEPVGGVRLELTRTGGVALSEDRLVAVSEENGRFHFGTDAAEEGEVVVDVAVEPPPPYPSYEVRGLTLSTSTLRGDGRDLGRWVVDPYVAFVGSLRMRRTWEPPRFVRGAWPRVTFRRTGGVEIDPAVVTGRADGAGNFLLAPDALGAGVIRGELTVEHPDLAEPFTRPLSLRTEHEDRGLRLSAVIGVGPSLAYQARILYRAGGGVVPGHPVEVEFQRTGGVPADPDTFIRETQTTGWVSLKTWTDLEGELLGDLIIRGPEPRAPDTIPVTMPTFKTDETRILERFRLGPDVNYVARLVFDDTGEPAADLEVRFQRTGGIAAAPDMFTATTDAAGEFPIQLRVQVSGDVLADLSVTLPSGGVETISDSIPTFEADEPRFLQEWRIGR